MLIEITYNVTDVFMSTTETPVYVEISFEQPGGTSAVWGSITGTLSNQTDLQNALNAKLDESTIDGGTEGQILSKASGTDFDFAWINNYAKYLATNVRNQTGSTIAAFQVVYISGATGNKPLISLADADTEATSSKTYGVTATSIANNGTGDVVTAGELSGINTSAFNEGDLLWLSTTAGGVVTSPPAEPAHAVFIGYVVRSHPTLGTIDVSIQNGYELNELHGVQITSAANNDGLFYNSSNGLWENKSVATVLGYTPEQPLTFNSPLSRAGNVVSIPQATGSVNGFLSATDWTTFNSKQAALGFTPANAATTLTINGVTFDLSTSRTWNISTGISGSGAAGQVTYWDGTSSVSGSNNLFWDNTNSRLGIGTNVPSNKLVISGSETAASGFARGILINTTLNAATNSDLLIGLDIQPVMAQGAFTNASPVAMRLFNPNTNAALDYGIQFRLQNTRTGQTGADGFLVSIDNAAIPNAYIYNYENASLIFGTNSTVNARLYPSGNLVLQNGGTFTDGGQRLQVIGDTLLRGSGNTSATTALTVQNSSSVNILQVLNNGYVRLGNLGNSAFRIYSSSVAGGGDVDLGGEFLTLNSRSGTTDTSSGGFVHINGVIATATSGTQNVLSVQKGFAPTSGNAVHTSLIVNPNINQTGGANGITRGLYVNPTLTAAADFRAIETTAGNVLFGASGTGFFWDNTNSRLGIGTNTPADTLHLNSGGIRIQNIRASLDNFYTAGVVNGLKIQNTTTNGRTLLGLVPNGTSNLADFWVFNTSDTTTNYSALAWGFEQTSNFWGINSISAGTGVTRPIYINATNAQNVGTANISFYTNGNVGIGTGSTAPSVRFGVTGDTLLRGSGATSATTALTVQNSASTNLFRVFNDGTATLQGNFTINNGTFYFINQYTANGDFFISASGSTNVLFTNGVSNNFGRLQLGGTSASYPSIKRASNNIEIKNADDTFGAGLSVGASLNASAILQADSTTKGFLPPRMTTTQKNAIATPAAGLVVYDTTLNKLCVYTTAWETITSI